MTSVSAGHIILALIQPEGSGRLTRSVPLIGIRTGEQVGKGIMYRKMKEETGAQIDGQEGRQTDR